MDDDLDLQSYASVIESALCLWDDSNGRASTDSSALRVLEHLLDKYHFHEDTAETLDGTLRRGYETVLSAMAKDLRDIPADVIVKILSVIYFVARRRARGGRDYFDVIHTFVGRRLGPGMRLLDLRTEGPGRLASRPYKNSR